MVRKALGCLGPNYNVREQWMPEKGLQNTTDFKLACVTQLHSMAKSKSK
jgi:hypothetical protein